MDSTHQAYFVCQATYGPDPDIELAVQMTCMKPIGHAAEHRAWDEDQLVTWK